MMAPRAEMRWHAGAITCRVLPPPCQFASVEQDEPAPSSSISSVRWVEVKSQVTMAAADGDLTPPWLRSGANPCMSSAPFTLMLKPREQHCSLKSSWSRYFWLPVASRSASETVIFGTASATVCATPVVALVYAPCSLIVFCWEATWLLQRRDHMMCARPRSFAVGAPCIEKSGLSPHCRMASPADIVTPG